MNPSDSQGWIPLNLNAMYDIPYNVLHCYSCQGYRYSICTLYLFVPINHTDSMHSILMEHECLLTIKWSIYQMISTDQYLAHCVLMFLHPSTLGNDQLMAALMDHTGAHCPEKHTHTEAKQTRLL